LEGDVKVRKIAPLDALVALGVLVWAIGVFLMMEEPALGEVIIRFVTTLFLGPSALSFFRYLTKYESPWHELPKDIQNGT